MQSKNLIFRILSAALALLLVFNAVLGTIPSARAASDYVKPQAGDTALLTTGEHLNRSDAVTTGTAYPYYSMWDTGMGNLRNFRFDTRSETGNKNYDPNTQIYCVQHGKTISTSQYTAAATGTDTWWNGLSKSRLLAFC